MKSNTYYFSHDYNAANDTKVLFLRHQLGMEGYGIYWYLIEQLANAGGKLPLELIPVLAMQMHCTDVKVNGVLMNFGLFTIDSGEFWSERLQNHLELRLKLSESGKTGANNRWGNRVAIGEGNAKESKVNKIKEKEIKLKEINIDFDFFWDYYDKRVGDKGKIKKKWDNLTDEERQKAFNFIESYKIVQPDKQFRKNPETFLNNKSWNDEIIKPTSSTKLTYAEREWEKFKNLG
jgi:predicted nuclease with TOPRIM domain